MRLKLSAGLIVVLGIVGGAATLAQGPGRGTAQPPEPKAAENPPPPTLRISAPEPVALDEAAEPSQIPGDEPLATPPRDSTTDDPMEVVESFVQRSRKEAEDAVRSLTEERARLRERLQKVESALSRWEKVSRAFADEGQVAPPTFEVPPLDLKPIESAPVEPPK